MNMQTPTLLIDKAIACRNIQAMAAKAKRNGLIFRPHFKTHQSQEVGHWFRQYGVTAITVSSVSMAKYFATAGWEDITIAIPFNIHEIDTVNELAVSIRLHLVVESIETLRFLAHHLQASVSIFIKIDTGYHRTGIAYNHWEAIDPLLTYIEQNPSLLSFSGFLQHAGHSYNARGTAAIARVHEESMERLQVLKTHYLPRNPELIVSTGDTPTCSVMEDFSVADEIRPGNFVYYDLTQQLIGSCSYEQIAVAIACPIIALHPERGEIIIYGGGVHFSKDSLEDPILGTIYGRLVANPSNESSSDSDALWGKVIEGAYVSKLSQEHGTIKADAAFIAQCQIGDFVRVLPVHSCMAVDLLVGI